MTPVTAVELTVPVREKEPIGRNRLLARLSLPDFALLGPHLVETVIDKGSLLQEPGQTIKRVYFPHSGLASLMGVLPEGDAIDAVTIGRAGAIGLMAGLGCVIAVSRAVVQLQMRAAYVPAAAFGAAADSSPALRAMIVRYNDLLVAQIQQSVACNALHHVQARLCRWLM